MINIREYITKHLLDPFKYNSTILQDSLLEVIIQRLEELYLYTVKFPEIVFPHRNRLDILKTIADQFLFDIRTDADLQEQIDILEHILYVYNRRGSVDTIENMWKYYGGKLPKDVKITVPSTKLFRYSRSALSGTDVFQDNDTNRPGVYEVNLVNNTYPIDELKEFMLKELVAAGNYIYFTNSIYSEISSDDLDTNPYKYDVEMIDYLHSLEIMVPRSSHGYTLSGSSPLSSLTVGSVWSGNTVLFMDTFTQLDIPVVKQSMIVCDNLLDVTKVLPLIYTQYLITVHDIERSLCIDIYSYSIPSEFITDVELDYYDRSGVEVDRQEYPGYFVLNSTLLGEEVV